MIPSQYLQWRPIRQRPARRLRASGFTLMEILIVVALIALLTSFAVPAYNNATAKSERAQMIADINKIAQAQERYYTINRSYTSDFGQLGLAATTNSTTLTSTNGMATYSVSALSSSSPPTCAATQQSSCDLFQIIGTPTSNAKNSWTLALSNTGVKTYGKGSALDNSGWPE